MSVLTISVVALTAFAGYRCFSPKTQVADLLLLENVEALTSGEENYGYFVHHTKYYNPITNLETNKCTAFSYFGPDGKCASPHNHAATECCSMGC